MIYHDGITGEGNMGDFVELIENCDNLMNNQIKVTREYLHQVKSVHLSNIRFFINKMASQLCSHCMGVLQYADYFCIVADEWVRKYNNREYCSTPSQYVTKYLEYGTMFLGFSNIPNTRSENVTEAILEDNIRQETGMYSKKCTA